MKLKLLVLLSLLIFIDTVNGKFQIRKRADRMYEIYDESVLFAKLEFKFINVAVLAELEYTNDADNFLVEFILHEKILPNSTVIIRAKRTGSSTEVRTYLEERNMPEEEIDCHYFSLINKPATNKVSIKLAPNMRFSFKTARPPFFLNNSVKNMEVALYRLGFFGKKKQSTKTTTNYQLVYNTYEELVEDLYCLKGNEIERPILFESSSVMFLFIFLVALIFALITLVVYYIFKVRKYTVN